MAVAMSHLGGIGIIHSNAAPSHSKPPSSAPSSPVSYICAEPVFKSPDDVIGSLSTSSAPCFVFVTVYRRPSLKLLRYVLKFDWLNLDKMEEGIVNYIVDSPLTMPAGYNLERIALLWLPENRGDL